MGAPIKQHLIDPEICIRCYTCENTCPINAIEHNDDNVVVNAELCNFCMDCIPVCPTGSIDEWRVVHEAYSLEEQYSWEELPQQEELESQNASGSLEAIDDGVAALLAEAHQGAGGKSNPPATAAKPVINLYPLGKPVTAQVQGNYPLTKDPDHDVRHIILDFGQQPMPVLEGQSLGVIAPGQRDDGTAHLPRLYSISSPRDGERSNFNNLSLTVKRDAGGLCSNYLCDLSPGDEVQVTGPFGASFLMPDDPQARILMICTGTGSAPMRAFTMRRQRAYGAIPGGMVMFFGARGPDALPYFGPLEKLPQELLSQHLVYSRSATGKEYVQDRMWRERAQIGDMLLDPHTYIYICGLRAMETGVCEAFAHIAQESGQSWSELRDRMRKEGRFHVETY